LGRNLVIGSGLALAAAGLLSLTLLDANDGPALLVTASMVLSLGIAPVVTLATDSIIGAAPPERAGAASALSEASSELGGALGIALLGSLGAALYRSHMMENLPEGLTPAVAAKLEGTVATALAAAETMNGPLGTEVSRRAREAFTHSFRVTALTSAVLLMSGAVLVAWRARRGGARSTKTRSDAELVPGAATE
jgi:DHA2 family multidrug resistance protein-like MFS transporter